MADFITPMVDILTRVWGCCSTRVNSIRKLEDNLTSLRNASDQLGGRCLDVKTKVEMAEKQPHLKRLNEVKDWLDKVEALQKDVLRILREGDQETQAKCFGGQCPKNCRASYKLQKEVTSKLAEVRELISRGDFPVLTQESDHDLSNEMPLDKTVGLESAYDELCAYFKDDKVGIIGLYGMGGVGKTTLLKKCNNELVLPAKTHDTVIWVVVSKEADLGKIQEVIGNKLHVQDGIWVNGTVDDKAPVLYGILKKKKFVLFLDDVWGRIDLLKLGVPTPNNCGSKIIFTTRSEEVCGHMEAHRSIRVQCLASEKAFELFKEKVGEKALDSHPDIPDLAKEMAAECKGLPLALCTVGRSMACKGTPREWKQALKKLKSYPSEFTGMVDDVYRLLEFSYDRLSNATYKFCFLYCSLFPEDYSIDKDELILLWIGEGFLAEFDDDIHEACNEGEEIISSLKYACLLENGDDEDSVKMHDVIRDMALWVACDHGMKTRFLVKDGAGTGAVKVDAKWQEVERLSLWGRGFSIQNFSGKPYFPRLCTMLIRDTLVENISTEVFLLTNTVKVLDLSGNKSLRNLSAAIENFVKLEYLNLSNTGITKLPDELKNLKNLRFLLLNRMEISDFPREVISALLSLKAFSMCLLSPTLAVWDENVLLHELEGLEHLQYMGITLSSPSSMQKLLISPKLQRRICDLRLIYSANTSSVQISHSLLRRMEHLNTLEIYWYGCEIYQYGCPEFDMEEETLQGSRAGNIPRSSFQEHEYTISLHKLTLRHCKMFDLNWLKHAPNLEYLSIGWCSMEEVISEDFEAAETERVKRNLFRSLAVLRLLFLPKLKSICRIALHFPCLKEISVKCCPNLMKFPFDSQSAVKNLKLIKGEQSWWDQLQWEDEVTKDRLISKFVSI